MLFHVFHLRWRVNYGVDLRGRRRRAVPYRAEDVAKESSEFGHSDVALLLTTLTHYHEGLSLEQLSEAFRRLMQTSDVEAEAVYVSWIRQAKDFPSSLSALSGLNLDGTDQFTQEIHPRLFRNMRVVEFWLRKVAYPIEAKRFPKKVVSTAWDLCRKGQSAVAFNDKPGKHGGVTKHEWAYSEEFASA